MRVLLSLLLLSVIGITGCNGNGKDKDPKLGTPGDHSAPPAPPPKTKKLEDMNDKELVQRKSLNNETVLYCGTENKMIDKIQHDRFFKGIERFFWVAMAICGLVMVVCLILFFWPNMPVQVKTIAVYAFVIALVCGGVCYLLAEFLKIILIGMAVITIIFGVVCVIYIAKHLRSLQVENAKVSEGFVYTSTVADKVPNKEQEFERLLQNSDLLNRVDLKALRDKLRTKLGAKLGLT